MSLDLLTIALNLHNHTTNDPRECFIFHLILIDFLLLQIIKLVHKSRALHRFQPNLALECEGVTTPPSLQPEDNMTANDRKALMAQFILSRKILIEKRAQNKYNAELNVPRDYEGTGYEDDDNDCDHLRNEDYIDENIFYEKDYR